MNMKIHLNIRDLSDLYYIAYCSTVDLINWDYINHLVLITFAIVSLLAIISACVAIIIPSESFTEGKQSEPIKKLKNRREAKRRTNNAMDFRKAILFKDPSDQVVNLMASCFREALPAYTSGNPMKWFIYDTHNTMAPGQIKGVLGPNAMAESKVIEGVTYHGAVLGRVGNASNSSNGPFRCSVSVVPFTALYRAVELQSNDVNIAVGFTSAYRMYAFIHRGRDIGNIHTDTVTVNNNNNNNPGNSRDPNIDPRLYENNPSNSSNVPNTGNNSPLNPGNNNNPFNSRTNNNPGNNPGNSLGNNPGNNLDPNIDPRLYQNNPGNNNQR